MSQKPDGYIYIDTKLDDSGLSSGINRMKSTVTTGVVAMAAIMASLAVSVISVGSEFESANAKASTLFGDAQVDMSAYQGKMLELSNKTGLAASELGNTMYDALSAGIPASDNMSESLGFLEKNSKLAKAGFTDINTATTATAKVLNAYKMKVSDTDRVHKVLMQTQNAGITTVNELGSVLSQVTPTASAMNVSFEQVGASLANMTAQGTPTAQATTQLNQLFAELGKNGTIGQKGLEAATQGTKYAGKSFQDLMKDGVPLNEILDLMGAYADSNGLSMLDMFSSIESGKAALAISGQNAAQYTKNLASMSTEVDVVGDAYEKVTNTFKEKSNVVMNSLKNVGIAAYSKFEEPLKGAMDSAQKAVNSLSKEMSSGKLGKSVDTVAEGFADLITIAIELASKAIPLIVNGFALIIDNSGKLATGLAIVGSAMLTYKTYTNVIQPITKAWQLATVALQAHEAAHRLTLVASAGTAGGMTILQTTVGVLTGKISLATAAAGALSSVMSFALSPVGMATIAIGALTAGIALLVMGMNNEEDSHRKKIETINEEIDSYKDLKKKQEEQLSANLSEIDNLKDLNSELLTLIDVNGKVKDGYEARAGFIVGELNSALGLNMQLVNGEIQGYKDLSTSIENLIIKKRAEIIIESQLPAYKEAVNKSTKAQIELNKIESSMSDISSQKKRLNAELEAGVSEKRKKDILAEMGMLELQLGEKTRLYDKQKIIVDGYYKDIASHETNSTLLASGNAEEIKRIETSVLANKGETANEKKRILEDNLLAEESYLNWLKNEYKGTNDEIFLGQIEAQKNKISNVRESLKEMTSTVDSQQEVNKNSWLNFAFKGVEGVISQSPNFKNSGYSTAREYFDAVIMSGGSAKNAGIILGNEAVKGTNSVSASGSGRNFSQGFINGSTAQDVMNSLFNTGMSIAGQVLSGLRTKGKERSPWKTTIKSGEYAAEGLVIGIENKTDDAVNAMSDLATGIIDKASVNPLEEMVSGMDTSAISSIIQEVQSAVNQEQMKFSTVATIHAKSELAKISQQNEVSNRIVKAALSGNIQVNVDLDGREVGIGLAPIIAEELAFQ